MIVEVVAHAGQIDLDIDAVIAEMIGRANAAEHEDLRRADGASRKNHLGGSAINLALSVLDDLHAGGATVFDDDALGMRVEDDGQVRKVLAADEALRGAMTHAVCAGHLVEARCELLGAVEVTVGFDPKIVGNRLGERFRNGADLILGMTSDVNLTVAAVVFIRAVLVALMPLEVGKDVVVAPAFASEACPLVVVRTMAAEVEQPVDRAASTEDLPPGVGDPAVVHMLLRNGAITPIDLRLELIDLVDQGDHAGLPQHLGVVGAASLDQKDAVRGGMLSEARREDTTGRAGAHDDIIKFTHAFLLPCGSRGPRI